MLFPTSYLSIALSTILKLELASTVNAAFFKSKILPAFLTLLSVKFTSDTKLILAFSTSNISASSLFVTILENVDFAIIIFPFLIVANFSTL